jgi:hypothetical protein
MMDLLVCLAAQNELSERKAVPAFESSRFWQPG